MIRALAFAVAAALLVGACKTLPPVDSFCEKHQQFDFTDRGFLGLSERNKKGLHVNDNTHERDCGGAKKPAASSVELMA